MSIWCVHDQHMTKCIRNLHCTNESNTVQCENLLCKKPVVPPWLWFEASILCFCQSVIKILCQKETHLDAESQDWIHLKQMNILQYCPTINVTCKALTSQGIYPQLVYSQGCGLAEPSGHWRLTFALRQLENL